MLKWLIDKGVTLYFRYQAQFADPNDRDLRLSTDRRKFDYDSDGSPYRPAHGSMPCECGDPDCYGYPTAPGQE